MFSHAYRPRRDDFINWLSKISSVHSAIVALSNSFRQIFNCCWRENPKMLLFYYDVLPIVHNANHRRILFCKKDNVLQQRFTQGTRENLSS